MLNEVFPPVHTLAAAVIVPPTAAGLTVTFRIFEVSLHEPLVTIALNDVVAVKLPVVNAAAVPVADAHVVPSVDFCHAIVP